MTDQAQPEITAVAIGRNEGARLVRCLASLAGRVGSTVYVDSGSTDASVDAAKAAGATVLALDMSTPFTAARARNVGFDAARQADLRPDLVQFIDGDCELAPGWIGAATAFLETRPDVALVCGRLRERRPDASIYNRLCDIEWQGPAGEIEECGGIFLIRASAFAAVDGFNSSLIAGEEPDLCFRLRQSGFKLARIADDMAVHDADMTRLSQWWRRMMRSGFAYADNFAMHGTSKERFRLREVARALIFGGIVPVLTIFGAVLLTPFVALIALVYPVQIWRIYASRSDLKEGRLAYAVACTLGRIPECLGIVKWFVRKLQGRDPEIIEYKSAPRPQKTA